MQFLRRKTIGVEIGAVEIGGAAPIAIQSMTNTDTADIRTTATQIIRLAKSGAEIVRVTVNNEAAARAVPFIREILHKRKCGVPIVGDFHFNGHLLLAKFPECAKALDKYRINPGNVGANVRDADRNFGVMIGCALKYGKPVRIGGNAGSLNLKEFWGRAARSAARENSIKKSEILAGALSESVLASAARARKLGMPANKIVLSVKTSDVESTILAYEILAKKCNYCLHLGLTEAGSGIKGLMASGAALAVLLRQGIGDMIRISLTPEIGAKSPRAMEIEACQMLLQSMGLGRFRPTVTSCPGCGRTDNKLLQKLTREVNNYIIRRMPFWKIENFAKNSFRKIENLHIGVMGCVVNGPGEAVQADIALCLPGKSEKSVAAIFVDGKKYKMFTGKNIGREFLKILEQYVNLNFL